MEEVTLLEAIYRLHEHKKKRSRIVFEVTFDEVSRTARFGKFWHKVYKDWVYTVKAGPHEFGFSYSEKEAVSAILSIPGMALHGACVKYHIKQVEPEVTI